MEYQYTLSEHTSEKYSSYFSICIYPDPNYEMKDFMDEREIYYLTNMIYFTDPRERLEFILRFL